MGDLLKRYEETVTPAKRGARFEKSRIKTLLAHSLTKAPLAKLSPTLVARYRDDRLSAVSGDSVRRELTIAKRPSQPLPPAEHAALHGPDLAAHYLGSLLVAHVLTGHEDKCLSHSVRQPS